jgi:hypothetical protein
MVARPASQEDVEMFKKIAVPLLGILIVAVAACSSTKSRSASSSGYPPSASVPAPANIGGVWAGQEVGGPTVSMRLKQNGARVTGDLDIAGRPDISGPVEGVVEGDTLKLQERTGYGSEPLLNIRGDRITGIVAGTTLNLRRVQ